MASSKASMKIRTKRATGRRPEVGWHHASNVSGDHIEGGGSDETHHI